MPAEPKYKLARDLGRSEILLCIARVPHSERVFLGASDGNVYALDAAADKLEPVVMEGHTGYVTGVAVSGDHVVSGAYDGNLIWWNATTRAQVRKFHAHDRWVRSVQASADGKWIASVGDDMVCRIWHADSGKLKHELRGHEHLT